MLRKIVLFFILTWFIANAAQALSPLASTTLLQDDVEENNGVWTSWTATGLWHRVDSGLCQNAYSGAASWYYGNSACNFNTGASNSGSLTSTTLAIPVLSPGSSASLSFWYYYETESTGTSYDRRYVQVSVDGGAYSNLIQLSGDSMNAWHQQTLDLTAYIGHAIQLRFFFDTGDSALNNFKGWYIDDINVSYTTTAVVYSVAPGTYSWVDIASSANDTGIACDDCGVTSTIGFNFPFFNSTHSTIGIASNGYLHFDSDNSDFSNDPIPDTNTPNDLIAPFWDDIYVFSGKGHVYSKTLGSSPNRTFVVEYANVDYYNSTGSGNLHFEVILSESDGSITYQYKDMLSVDMRGSGSSATIGVENSTGTAGTQYSYNTSGSISDGQAITFTRIFTDTDGDGLPDWWEVAYGTDPSDANDPSDVNADEDEDGLSWLLEYQYHTNPLDPDTDHDDVNDGDEVATGTNPLVNDKFGPTTVTYAGPGSDFGTAYFKFSVGAVDSSTTGYRVYYGPVSGNAASDYPAFLDMNNLTDRFGYIDQQWGMQGQPQVFFRIAAIKSFDGRTYAGAVSNEMSTYFAGNSSKNAKQDAATIVTKTGALSGIDLMVLLGVTLFGRRFLKQKNRN